MLKIGDFSKLSRISIRMLRYYDERGLLMPNTIDDFTGYRYYTEDQLQIASRIVALKDMGFALSVIAEILKSYDNPQSLAKFLAVKQAEVQAEVEETSRRLRLLETAIKRLRKDDTAMNYNVNLKTLPQRYVASVRKVLPAYDQESLLWNIMMTETAPLKMQFAENSYSMAIFHDEGHKERDLDVEIQGSVKGNYENTENVVFKTVPAIEIASATYNGSYDQITAVNQAVANWMRDNGYQINGAMFCIYHVSPAQAQNPDEFVTEVCYPVKKK
ncbi:MerR family transcriptional regulator [Anaerotignum sp. MB30-C6]|uniref:MerR family transcriptional regulator n=1 Tax=Anaerotignum sp. MB30-C6 TaxID=3070814 RepID=UPI0027DD9115|nr:MerR family transcriptional regulator [Anaerotignum sp. MB30-C6]WMI80008.1 MerR family transcriptional regulator [Anaerotignum sp. MB30-C6]